MIFGCVFTGEWLAYNGDAIYSTSPWTKQNDTYTKDVWYTKSKRSDNIYITFFNWPKLHQLELASISIFDTDKVFLLEKHSKRVLNVRLLKVISFEFMFEHFIFVMLSL